MGRLIDADALIEQLEAYEEELKNDREIAIETDDEQVLFAIMNQKTAIYRIIRNVLHMPTAFDKEKVLAELEELADNSNDHMYESYFDGKEDGIREAIAIIKRGGVE